MCGFLSNAATAGSKVALIERNLVECLAKCSKPMKFPSFFQRFCISTVNAAFAIN